MVNLPIPGASQPTTYPNLMQAWRGALSVDALQPVDLQEAPHEAVEHLAARGPGMAMSPD